MLQQGVWIQTVVWELRPCVLRGMAKKRLMEYYK